MDESSRLSSEQRECMFMKVIQMHLHICGPVDPGFDEVRQQPDRLLSWSIVVAYYLTIQVPLNHHAQPMNHASGTESCIVSSESILE